ncbi:MAG: hypothetical protein Q9162_000318 [Coniocarpon cinnabarinum]
MGYLINEGYPEAAKKFASEANLQPPTVAAESIEERIEIRSAILSGRIEDAIEHINDLTPEVSQQEKFASFLTAMIIHVSCTTLTLFGAGDKKHSTSVLKMSNKRLTVQNITLQKPLADTVTPQLLDRNTRLHFSLLRLQLTELIRNCMSDPNSDITPAINFASSQLAPIAPSDPQFLADLERTMALLIFPPENLSAPLAGLLDPELRRTVAVEVNHAILEELDCPSEGKLKGLIKLRAWAERRAKEKKLPLPPEGLDFWSRRPRPENGLDGEDSIMNE